MSLALKNTGTSGLLTIGNTDLVHTKLWETSLLVL